MTGLKRSVLHTHRSKMEDSLRGHRASHEANKLQLGAILGDCSHRSISNLQKRREESASLHSKPAAGHISRS